MSHPDKYDLPHETFRPHQEESIVWAATGNKGTIKIGEMPTGCHARGQGILMHDGSVRPVESITLGDKVMGPDSMPRIVSSTHHGIGQMYKIIPTKGEPFIVNDEHVLTLIRTNCGGGPKGIPRKRRDCKDGKIIDVPVRDWLKWTKNQKHIHKLYRVPVRFTKKLLLVDPYFLGVILGDGHVSKYSVVITSMDNEIVECVYEQALQFGLLVRKHMKLNNKAASYDINNAKREIRNTFLLDCLQELGLVGVKAGDKFIPVQYKTGSREDRLQILAGLIDTDGSYSKAGYDFISKSNKLAKDVVFLARSLGFAAYVTSCEKRDQNNRGGTYYRVSISGNLETIPCRVSRKKHAGNRLQKKDVLRTGFSVEKLETGEYYGFSLYDEPHYLLDTFEVTHNSGKSSIAMAQSVNGQVVVLTKSKSLQQQYGSEFTESVVLYGRSNYPCSHKHALPTETAADCRFGQSMSNCPYYEICQYPAVKELAHESSRVVLNYAYWLVTYPKWNPSYLVMDEAHNLSNIVLDYVGTTISKKDQEYWELPEFPRLMSSATSALLRQDNIAELAVNWLGDCGGILGEIMASFPRELNERQMRRRRSCDSLLRKCKSTEKSLSCAADIGSANHWYIRSGDGALHDGPGFNCRPLTARYDFNRFFTSPDRMSLCMSATIGNKEAFATELGITNYDTRVVPNQWPARTRPVHSMNVPSMGHQSTMDNPGIFDKQADEIAKAILSCPKDWCGLILVTRKKEAKLLADRLAMRGLQDRVWVTPGYDGTYAATQEQLEAWNARKKKVKNSIAISWAFWEGFDGVEEKIVICAKAPYPFILDDYERERMQYDGSFFLQRTAYMLEQGLGRTRRGNAADYDIPENGVVNGYVGIADGSWRKIQRYFSQSLREAIVGG